MNEHINVFEILVIALLAVSLAGCAGAPAVAAGDCLALQEGTAAWVLNTAVNGSGKYLLTLQNTMHPSQIVTFARVAEGVGMASVDLEWQSERLYGTYFNSGKDLTAILRSALSKGNWKIISRDEVTRVITTGGTAAPVLLQWVTALTTSVEVLPLGLWVLPANIMDDTLRGLGIQAGEPG